MNKYLIVYLEPANYYIEVVKYGCDGKEKETIEYKETKTAIFEAKSKEEASNKCEYEVINIIKLNEE